MNNHLLYCQPGTDYYERRAPQSDERFSIAAGNPPDDWSRSSDQHWNYLLPRAHRLREQGWKIHISVTLDAAENVLKATAGYCFARGIAFKFLASRGIHEESNRKDATRASSGKLVTIYPRDDDQLLIILEELSELLAGRQGPYILSDLRWGEGPLYIRYGGFRNLNYDDGAGDIVPGIRKPDGTVVPDTRGPGFEVPDWVTVPEKVRQQISSAVVAAPALPYTIDKALHFSNGGGIYLASDVESGLPVVLREARPHAGLDAHGQDAVARLYHEARVLDDLRDLDFVPTPYRCFTAWEHHFLAEEYFEGVTLWDHLATANPLTRSAPDPESLRDYCATVVDVCDQLEAALDILHGRGYVYADLHPRNVILRPDGKIALVDFEAAYRPGLDPPSAMGVPGFSAPHSRSDDQRDDYALNSIRLFLFLPMTQLLALDPSKVEHLADVIGELFPVPPRFLEAIRNGLSRPEPAKNVPSSGTRFSAPVRDSSGVGIQGLIEAMATSIEHSATVERTDRLFPGDPEGLENGGYTLAHGASGVLHALHLIDWPIAGTHIDWLVDAVGRAPVRSGLYDGMHGVAVVLHGLGRTQEAIGILERLEPIEEQVTSPNLDRGLAGIGLALRYFAQATGESRWHERLIEVEHRLADHVRVAAPTSASGPPGLLHGSTGAALFFLRRYEDHQDPVLLDLARICLQHDLRRCETNKHGEYVMKDGVRALPYLGTGSAGLLEPLTLYTRHRPDSQLSEIRSAVERACAPVFTIEPGLSQGRAGLIVALAGQPADPARAAVLDAQVERLAWHAIQRPDGIAFPGSSLLRLSMDLSTGTAGVMVALSQYARHSAPAAGLTSELELLGRAQAIGLPVATPLPIDVRANSGPDGSADDWSIP